MSVLRVGDAINLKKPDDVIRKKRAGILVVLTS